MATPPAPTTARATAVFAKLTALTCAGAVAQGAFGLAIARWLAPSIVGSYFVGLAIVTLVGTLGRLGTEQLALREASPLWSSGDRAGFHVVSRMVLRANLLGSITVAAATAAVLAAIHLLRGADALGSRWEIWLAVVVLVTMNVLTTGCALLRAADRILASAALRYLAVFGPALCLVAASRRIEVLPSSPMAATLITSAIAAALVWRAVFALGDPSTTALPRFAPHVRSGLRLTASTGMNGAITWTDRIILGTIAGVASVSTYGVAWQLVMPFSLLLVLGGSISAPRFSRLFASGEKPALESTARSLSTVMLLVAAITGAGIVAASGTVLSLLGGDYGSARPIVAVLVLGQIINVGAGPIGAIYAMAGRDDVLVAVTGAAAFVSVVATVLLTMWFGSIGTAIGVSAGLAVKNIALVALARRHLDIAPSALLRRNHPRPAAGNHLAALLS